MTPTAIVVLVTVVVPSLLAGELAFELAVTVEQDAAVLGGERAAHVHRVAVADIGPSLERALVVECRGEGTLGPALLLERALHGLAVDGEVDGDLVRRALRRAGDAG